ncbi:MAG: hypothetical protein ACLSBH_17530 [Coprobacillus cateniformis]
MNDTIFIIFGCTRDAARFIEQYPNFKEINYGGIAKKRVQNHMEMLFI